jgi:CRISPR-associated protein Csm3
MVLNIWEQDGNESELFENLFKSLELLRDDYLGGSGSRGYGQVSIDIEKILQKKSDSYYGVKDAKPENITEKFKDQIEKLKS